MPQEFLGKPDHEAIVESLRFRRAYMADMGKERQGEITFELFLIRKKGNTLREVDTEDIARLAKYIGVSIKDPKMFASPRLTNLIEQWIETGCDSRKKRKKSAG
jgi:hypothetical protein